MKKLTIFPVSNEESEKIQTFLQDNGIANSDQKFHEDVSSISMEEIFCESANPEGTLPTDAPSSSKEFSYSSPDPTANESIHASNQSDTVNANISSGGKNSENVSTDSGKALSQKKNKHNSRKCSAKDCQFSEVLLFSFPAIVKNEQVIDKNFNRCKEWVQNAGNEKLLEMPSSELYKKHWLCSAHFKDDQFYNKMRKRLKPDAVPTIFTSLPLSDENMFIFPVWGRHDLQAEIHQNDPDDILLNENKLDAYQKQFEREMLSYEWRICNTCKAKFMTKKDSKQKCVYSVPTCKKFSELGIDENVPEELKCLTFIEEQLIAKIHPIVSVIKLKGHQLGYKGNIINYPQGVKTFAEQLPHKISDLPCVLTIRASKNLKPIDFQVRGKVVLEALLWLKENNFYYSQVP
ncbi:52 kDa repressor of the inhibitor of the protein kinase [Frankliniella fusca]|uniref:52 kDa repressor of the inhibitor of the protein kinase n=1 Tax=Frankliniella fusca TaxID=407009 RepID=A0AAE1LKH2_9NEOP|nr:52 kDa repressor of the inhibitor of the protein kinase [Frankliniella fusca]